MTGMKVGDSYSLQQVQKAGYELNEKGTIGRQYAFSDRVPLTIVMVSTAQLQEDKQRIENNAYHVAEKNYHAKLAQLEKDKEAGIITIEAYRQELQDLQDKFEKYQSLIDGLAEHYVHTDYDGLDEKEREINLCIENGDLERADSLIRTIFDPTDVLKRNQKALSRIDQDIQQANDIITQAKTEMAAVLKQQEKNAEYLYQLYTIALSKFDNEKARQYIETRAELDTMNVEWQLDAGYYNKFIAKFDDALCYFYRVLHQTREESNPQQLVATCFEEIAIINRVKGNYSLSKKYYDEALQLRVEMEGENSQSIASIYLELAMLYAEKQEYKQSSDFYIKSSNIYATTSKIFSRDYAVLLLSMGESLFECGDYKNATESVQRAVQILLKLNGQRQDNIAVAYSLLSRINREQGNFTDAINWANKALELALELFGKNHLIIANIYSEIGLVYSDQGNYLKALEYHRQSLNIYIDLFGNDNRDVGINYGNIAICYSNLKQYATALDYFQRALTSTISVFGEYHTAVARTCENIGITYQEMADYPSALTYYLKALPIYERLFGKNHKYVVNIYNLVAFSYLNNNNPITALHYYKEALEISKRIYSEDESNNMIAMGYNNLYHNYVAIMCQEESDSYIQEFRNFMSGMAFVGTIVDYYPAYNKGLRGEYYLLEFNKWTQDSLFSLFKYNYDQKGKPKKYLLL